MPASDFASTTAVILPPERMSFTPVAGVPLIVRIAVAAQRAGCERVIALAPSDALQLQHLFARDPRTRGVVLANDGVAAQLQGERVLLLPSDYLVTPPLLRAIGAAAADGPVRRVRFAGTSESDPGILLGPPALLLPALAPGAAADPPPPAAAVVRAVMLTGIRVAGPEQVAAAETFLLAEIRAASADTDGPIARFDRALSTRLSRLLVRTPLRPNHLTLLGTAIGLLAAWCLARGEYWPGLAGALLFWAAIIIDGCDGEVARLRFQESRFGHLLDVGTDNLVHVALFVGLGVGAYRKGLPGSVPLLSALLVSGFLCASAATYVCLLRHPPVKQLQPLSLRGRIRRGLLRGFESLMNRDFAYLLLLLAAVDRLHWFLWGAAFGTYGFAAALVWVYRWRDAA